MDGDVISMNAIQTALNDRVARRACNHGIFKEQSTDPNLSAAPLGDGRQACKWKYITDVTRLVP
jgi:hypothetical protein